MRMFMARFSRRRCPRLVGVMILVSSVSVASSQTRQDSARFRDRSVYQILAEAPKAAQLRKNPFQGDARETIAGGKLFEQHCTDCHGKMAEGTRYGPSLLSHEVQQVTPGTLFWVLTNGVVRRGMPVWSKLPEPERWQIVTYIQSLSTQSTTTDHKP